MPMELQVMTRERRVAVAPGKMRKTLTLPKELVARVRAFRFARQYDQESDAYAALLEMALAQVEREEQEKPRRKP
jgi:hypothetical protein